jgi:hypothetical protein
MLNFIRNHPYLTAGFIVFILLFVLGVFALEFSVGESLLGSAVLSAVGVGGIWWKEVGFG